MDNIKVGLVSLGCPKNKVDAEVMLKRLTDDGFIYTEDTNNCDALIINTCGFIESAKEEAVNEIFTAVKLKESGNIKKIIVSGCFSKRYPKEIHDDIKEVDAILGVTQYVDINKYVKKLFEEDKRLLDVETDLKVISCKERAIVFPRHRADIKIAEGCSNNCAYCAIPNIRGPYRSRQEADIIIEAQDMIQRGVKEITLIAQDTTRYGVDLKTTNFLQLLTKLSKLDESIWLRVLYAYPEMISEELINLISENKNICNYIDMPLQHINDEILRKMNRRSDRKLIIDKYEMIKRINPDIAIRTTFITGFPGETKQQFKELYEFISDYPFENVGVFSYSPEEGTPAYDMMGRVGERVSNKRRDELMKKQRKISEELLSTKIGTTQKVLIEDFDEQGLIGRTQHMAAEIDGVVRISSNEELYPGDFYECEIISCTEYDLNGKVN